MNSLVDVVIIGGGWSGIMACKYAEQYGLSAIVVEKRDGLGGVWRYSDDKNIVTVMKTTESTSSATVTEQSDHHMPVEFGYFPKHDQVLRHLVDYVKKFKLEKNFIFGESVVGVRKEFGTWQVTTDKAVYHGRQIVIASGVHQKPNVKHMRELFSGFTGKLLHSGELKEIDDAYANKRVLVYGGGETASDVVELLEKRGARVTMAIPNGQHFFQKRLRRTAHLASWMIGGKPGDPLDAVGGLLLNAISPVARGKPGYSFACRFTTGGAVDSYDGHGIPQWRSDAKFFHAFVNKNAAPVDLVKAGRVTPKRKVFGVHGRSVAFCDGTNAEFDVVIACTGYSPEFPFLQPPIAVRDLYKFVFSPRDTSLAFIGIIRPVIFSIPMLTEFQCKWVMKSWAGQCDLPSEQAMTTTVERDKLFWADYFKETSHRVVSLVEPMTYIKDVLRCMGGYHLSPLKMLFRSPSVLMHLALGAPATTKYLLSDSAKNDSYIAQASSLRSPTSMALNIRRVLLALFGRVTGFDAVTHALGALRLRAQLGRARER